MSVRRDIEIGRPKLPRLTAGSTKGAILVGFGLIVGVWVFAALYFGGRITDLDDRTNEVRDRYVLGQELLNTARMQILLSSVHLRDALLDATPAAGERHGQAMAEAFDRAAESLQRYVPILDSTAEQARVSELLTEITQLRRAMLEMLPFDAVTADRLEPTQILGQLTPRRQAVMAIADQIGTINRTAFLDHQTQVVALYRTTQGRIWTVLGVALALSLGIAGISVWYAGRLETQVRAQHTRDVEMQRGLQRLSAQLIRVREEERRSLARELHDDVGQLLTAAKFELVAAQNDVADQGGAADALAHVRTAVERALQTVRDLSHMLHPSVLDDLGLSAAVDLHVKEFRRRQSIKVDLSETGLEERLPREVEMVAYRVVQEALTNVAKHANAKTCRVSLVQLARSLMVVVGDDGEGFDQTEGPTTAEGRGIGLVSMRERATQVGGTLVVESAPGRGTRVVAELPVVRGEFELRPDEDGPEEESVGIVTTG